MTLLYQAQTSIDVHTAVSFIAQSHVSLACTLNELDNNFHVETLQKCSTVSFLILHPSNDKCALLSLQILVAAPIQQTTEFRADTVGDNVGICKLHPDHIVKGASDVGKSNMCCSFERQQFWCTYSFPWMTLENSPGSKGAVANRSPPRCVEVPQPHSFQFGSSQALQGDGQAL